MITFTFTHQTLDELQNMLETANRENSLMLFKRVRCLQLIAAGRDFSEIAELLGKCERTIRNWLWRFLTSGFSWLKDYAYSSRGRKSKLTVEQKQRLYDIIVEGPEAYGFDCGLWTSGIILEVVKKEFNVTYNPRYLCELLDRIGLSFQKAKFVTDQIDDEKYQKQRQQWEEETWPSILKQAKELKAVILFGDEVSFAQWGSLARTWAPKGEQPVVKTSGNRKGLKMFGVIEFKDGGFHYMESNGKFNAEAYVKFLKFVLDQYRCPVILIEDGASYHNGVSKAVKKEMEAKGRLFVYRLPAYSPEFNPIEKLWKSTKKEATHLKYFPTFDSLRDAVVKAFNKFMEDAMKVVCVMKKLRAEAGIA